MALKPLDDRVVIQQVEAEEKTAAGIDRGKLAVLQESLGQRIAQLQELFAEEVRGLPAMIKEHGSLGRYLVVLGDPRKEALVAEFVEPMLPKAAPAAAPEGTGKGGFWSALMRWFRK